MGVVMQNNTVNFIMVNHQFIMVEKMEEKVILSNAFSLGMLPQVEGEVNLRVRRINTNEVRQLIANGFFSAVGHQATAELLSTLLGVQVPLNRVNVTINDGQQIIICQLLVRLAEGQVLSLPEIQSLLDSGKIVFYLVTLS